MYEFTEDCLTGIKEIDDEHRRLFQMVNEAIEMSRELDDVSVISDRLIVNLKDYAATHFAHEEAYMESINDPELSLQKKEHAAFTAKVNQFVLNTSSMEAAKDSFAEFIAFLVRWLYHHILSSDMMIGKIPAVAEEKKDMFAFTDIYKTGIELVDDEHRRLFEIIGETKALIDEQFLADKYDHIMNLLDQLREYTETHFEDEEALMTKINYPELESQKRAHASFIEKLVEIDLSDITQMDDNQHEYLLELIQFLVSWLANHILGCDKKIGEYVRANGIDVE